MSFLIFILPYFYFLKINHYSYTCLASLPASLYWDVHTQKGTLGSDSSLLYIKYIDSVLKLSPFITTSETVVLLTRQCHSLCS